ncbi:MAG TPA: hypothetical protein VH208_05415 [Myxococcaceae bacterium]|nr:hypothetical protein [Myxococcaceae bacterium]
MKPQRLLEVRALIVQPEFLFWWDGLQKARADLAAKDKAYDELLSQTTLMEFRAELTQKNAIDTLYRAGACEDAAANMVFEATELENRSFKAVADFEEQRYKSSELWYRLGAAEKALDEKREQPAPQKGKRTETDLHALEKTHRAASDDYERELARKNRLWDEVERIWARSAEVSLLVAEQKLRGKRIRKSAEVLFALAEERKHRARELRSEAEAASQAREAGEARIQQLLEEARDRFGCAAGEEFIYFRQKDNQKLAFCVPLVEDSETYNVEVKPLTVYSVDRQRGVTFLEPARADAPSVEEGDRRFEEYFLKGRKGASAGAAQQ